MNKTEAIEQLAQDFELSPLFSKVYKNTVPVWTAVNTTPAVAVLYSEEEADRDNMTNNRIRYTGTILVYLYNKQATNKHEDILSELIDEAQSIVLNNNYLKCETIDTIVESMKRDGGIIHPFAMAQLKITIKYQARF